MERLAHIYFRSNGLILQKVTAHTPDDGSNCSPPYSLNDCCTRSHLALWKRIGADATMHDKDWAIVLEDDAVVHPMIRPSELPAVIETAAREAELQGAQFMYLGLCHTPQAGKIGPVKVSAAPGLRDLYVSLVSGRCTHAYALQRGLARALESKVLQTGGATIDSALQILFSAGEEKALGVGPTLKSPYQDSHIGFIYQQGAFFKNSLTNHQAYEAQPPPCTNKVFWRPKGRLGNMMFGYASLVGIAQRIQATPVIDADCTNWDRNYDARVHRLCEFISTFNIPAEPVPSECPELLYSEEAFGQFEPQAFVQSAGTSFDGYFQSWKYFEGAERVVRQMFTVPSHLQTKVLNEEDTEQPLLLYLAQRKNGTACMQIRREDKVGMQYKYELEPASYFVAAWNKIQELLGVDEGALALVITAASHSDASWARSQLKVRLKGTQVYIHRGTYLEDFAFLQNSCDALILSGSTFGWWAGFTSARARVVIAPKGIMNPGNEFSKQIREADYYPPSFVLLEHGASGGSSFASIKQ
mmetsp:Transcript_123646/g.276056  ORF Transcript_123646/g.276056 Transcript_123646/m.276056 type:complete len:528 (+) Transcript_123646:2-1585(+)